MDNFNILGIEQTKNKELIKNAYRTKLMSVNPEDDPEGFKQLRKAYEDAISYCDLLEEDETAQENISPIDMWIKRVKEIYSSIEKRQDLKCWQTLLEDELCLALDTEMEVREQLLQFLMDHFRLPRKIYRLIDEVFHIVSDKHALVEYFPENFLNFFQYQVETEEFFDYSLFQGDEYADYDSFLEAYFDIKENIDSKNPETIDKQLAEIEAFEIFHPYLTVERLKFIMEKDASLEEANSLKKELILYKNDIYIRYYLMLLEWKQEHYDNAYEDILYLLKHYPNHFSAKKKLAEYHYLKKDCENAKELCMELLEINGSDEELIQLMEQCNLVLIDKFQTQLEDNPKDIDTIIELSWCFYQNKEYKKCLEQLELFQPTEEYQLDYNNLKGRNYVALRQYEEALPCLSVWEQEIMLLKDDGTEKTQKKKSRYSLARYLQALCYAELSKQKESDTALKEKAIQQLQVDIDSWKDVGLRLSAHSLKAQMCLELNRNEQCIDLCNHILQIDPGYYPAYLYLQEAYFNLDDGQKVIDIFYKAIEIFPYYVKPYLLAIKMFYYYGQLEDANKILDLAKENNLSSNELDLYEIRVVRYSAKTQEETRNSIELCEVLEKKLFQEDNDITDFSEVFLEKIYAYMDLDEYEIALKEIDSLLSKHPKNHILHTKANILCKLGQYQNALSIYENNDNATPSYYYDLARCYEDMELYSSALETYEMVLQYTSSYRNTHSRMMNLYERDYKENWDRTIFEKALESITKQLEAERHPYYLIERGLLYTDGSMLEEAIADFKEAIEMDPDSIYAYNNLGFAYKLCHQYSTAIEYYEKAISLNMNCETSLPFMNLARIYMITHEFKKAYETYQTCKKLFPKISIFNQLADACRRDGNYEKALDIYTNALTKDKHENVPIWLEIAETYEEMDNFKQAKKYYKLALRVTPQDVDILDNLARLYWKEEMLSKKTIYYFEKVIKFLTSENATPNIYINLMKFYSSQQDDESVKLYFKKALDYYKDNYNSIENYLDDSRYKIIQAFDIFRLYYYAGYVEESKKYLDMMHTYPNKCVNCNYDTCVEAHLAKGLYAEATGCIEEAIEAYETALAEDINYLTAKRHLEALRKQ